MIEVVGLGRGAGVPPGTLVPAELSDPMGAPGYEAVRDGMRIGFMGAPESEDPSLLRLQEEAAGRAIDLSFTWGQPLLHALSLPAGRTVFGSVEARPGDLLIPGPGPFEPRRHGLFDPGETLLVFDDVRQEGRPMVTGDAHGREFTRLSAVYRPHGGGEASTGRLVGVMAALRSPAGCPWDREQDHLSLRRFILEEAAEAVDALGDGDAGKIREELGDLLLQVVFQARLFEEEGTFGFAEVASGLVEKLLRRHPHVFGGGEAKDASEVKRLWQQVKESESEKKPRRLVDEVPRSLPAFERLCAMLRITSRLGIDADFASLPARGIVAEAARLMTKGRDPATEVEDAVDLFRAGLASIDEVLRPGGEKGQKYPPDGAKTAFFHGIEAKLAGKKKD